MTPQDPGYDGAWSEFVSRLVARYPLAVGVEVWNEENLAQGFLPRPDPARYTQLLQEAYVAAKSVDPSMPVISGGLFASTSSGRAGLGDAQFLRSMYAAGAKGYMDGIGIHIYPTQGTPAGDVDEMENDLNALRSVRDAAHGTSTPIWITEAGVSSQVTSQRAQAADLVAIDTRLRRDRDVAAVIIHRLVDPPATGRDPYAGAEVGYGVFAAGDVPKLAACALSRLWHGTLRC